MPEITERHNSHRHYQKTDRLNQSLNLKFLFTIVTEPHSLCFYSDSDVNKI